jgi:hypothetical protein
MKNFPIPILEILPVAVTAATLSGEAIAAVDVSSTRDPVVAPAGTVLRVRLSQTLETGRSRPGDRFSDVVNSTLLSGSVMVLPKRDDSGRRVVSAPETQRYDSGAALAGKLTDCSS